MALNKHSDDEDDSDLADLLGNHRNINSKKRGGNSATASLNLDHLTQAKLSLSPQRRMPYSNYHNSSNLIEYTCSYLSMMCYFYPRLCGLLIIGVICLILFGLANTLFNPVEHFGHINHDLILHVHSKYDFEMANIDHWCLVKDDNCRCESPLVPQSRSEHRSWVEAFTHNRKMLKKYEKKTATPLDVVFIGESVVEEMDGRWMGLVRSDKLEDMYKIFRQNFSRKAGATMEGVALGIAGDAAPNVLWRLMHGELPDYVDPKVFWISVGNNDLGRMQCSEEVVVFAVLRVVEEILEKRPNARVVINSLFPMMNSRGGDYPLITDYTDAFAEGATTSYSLKDALAKDAAVEQGDRRRRLWPWSSKASPVPPEEGQITLLSEDEPSPFEIVKMSAPEMAEKEEKTRLDEYTARMRNHPFFRHKPASALHNPLLMDKEEMRKYKVTSAFTQQNALPLWTSIRAINTELESFAQKEDRVSFFDATSVFVEQDANGYRSRMRSDLMSVTGHPTMEGVKAWQTAIVEYLEPMLKDLQKQEPKIFTGTEDYETRTIVDDDEVYYDDMVASFDEFDDDNLPGMDDDNHDDMGSN